MTLWTGEKAADLLSQHYSCHYRKTKSANFSLGESAQREISMALGRRGTGTAYINRFSVTGNAYPNDGIDGVSIEKSYPKGYQGLEGNPGIAASVARHNPSLDPASNDVLLMHVRDEQSLWRLLDWYKR